MFLNKFKSTFLLEKMKAISVKSMSQSTNLFPTSIGFEGHWKTYNDQASINTWFWDCGARITKNTA